MTSNGILRHALIRDRGLCSNRTKSWGVVLEWQTPVSQQVFKGSAAQGGRRTVLSCKTPHASSNKLNGRTTALLSVASWWTHKEGVKLCSESFKRSHVRLAVTQ